MKIEILFDANSSRELGEVRWSILVGKEGDRVRVIDRPEVEMLFAGVNAGLLFSVYPTAERLREPNEVELTVRTAFIKGEADGPDWSNLTQKIKASGMNMTTRVLLRSDEVVDFCDAASLELARRGECRWVEFLLDDKVIANYLSSGDKLWEYNYDGGRVKS